MADHYVYIGFFVCPEELLSIADLITDVHLQDIIKAPHVTVKYKPCSIPIHLFGEKVNISIIAYANDGHNEGFKVEVCSDNPDLQKMIEQIVVPHITISIGQNAKAVNTKNLDFVPITPVEIEGIFGGYSSDSQVITNIK